MVKQISNSTGQPAGVSFGNLPLEQRKAIVHLNWMIQVLNSQADVDRAINKVKEVKAESIAVELLGRKNWDSDRRIIVAYVLGQFVNDVPEAIPQLIELMGDDNPSVQYNAASSLSLVNEIPKELERREMIPKLIRLLEDKSNPVIGSAAYILGLMGKEAESALPKLNELYQNKREEFFLSYAHRQAYRAKEKIEGRMPLDHGL